MNITPGIVLADGEEITTDKLNLLGTPTVALDDGDKESIAEDLQERLAVARRNYFTNPGLDQWTRGTGPVTCATGARQLLANGWWVRCNATTSGSPTYSRVTAPNGAWIYAAKIAGALGVGPCDFGQDIAPHVAAALSPKITVTFDIFNGTGAAVTPEVRLDTCDTSEDYDAVTNRVSVVASTSVANNTLQTFTVTLETAAYQAQLRNGAQLYIRIPSPALGSDTAYVHLQALKVEIGSAATQRYTERELTPAVSTGSSSGSAAGGWLRNGDFARWLAGSVTCAEDVETFAAEGWSAKPADGSTLVYARSTSVPGTEALYSAELTGAAAVTAQVDFSQEIPAVVAANLRRLLVFSAYIYNGTGADFQPVLRLDTCDSTDNFSAVTNRVSTTASTCPNAQWTRVSFTVDGASAANVANGAKVIIRFPGGTLDAGTKVVRIAQAQLDAGASVTAWSTAPVIDGSASVTGVRGVVIVSRGNNVIPIAAEEAVLMEPGGSAIRIMGVDLTITATTSGAGGLDTGSLQAAKLYDVWLISTGATHAGLLCLSGNDPVMPAGYRYKALIGVVRGKSASANIEASEQRGDTVRFTPLELFNGTVSVAATYQEISFTDKVPARAASALLEVRVLTSGQALRVALKSKSLYVTDVQYLAAASNTTGVDTGSSTVFCSARAEAMFAEATTGIYFKAETTTPTYQVVLLGYRLK